MGCFHAVIKLKLAECAEENCNRAIRRKGGHQWNIHEKLEHWKPVSWKHLCPNHSEIQMQKISNSQERINQTAVMFLIKSLWNQAQCSNSYDKVQRCEDTNQSPHPQ